MGSLLYSEGYLFTLLIVSFVEQKLLRLIRSHLFIFAFISNILGGALARYSVSREVPCSVLKWETVLGSLDATPKVP